MKIKGQEITKEEHAGQLFTENAHSLSVLLTIYKDRMAEAQTKCLCCLVSVLHKVCSINFVQLHGK